MQARAAKSRPRLILALLLALLIDTLRPAVHPVAHQHAGDDRPHTHVGEVATRPRVGVGVFGDDARRVPDGEAGLVAAPATALHRHVLRALHASHVAPARPAIESSVGCVARVGDTGRERASTRRRQAARGPPDLTV